jgi:hypothetical protein
MGTAILPAIAASLCTATSSVCQRLGARDAVTSAGFDIGLIFRLARRPVRLFGVGSMILGFVFQVTALRYGPLGRAAPPSPARRAAVPGATTGPAIRPGPETVEVNPCRSGPTNGHTVSRPSCCMPTVPGSTARNRRDVA